MRGTIVAAVLACVASVLAFAMPGVARPRLALDATFEPLSASFVSSATGFVLGTSGCSVKLPSDFSAAPPRCRAEVVRTTDGGGSWNSVSAPATILSANQAQTIRVRGRVVVEPFVGGVVFADANNGWLHGTLGSTRYSGTSRQLISLNSVRRPPYLGSRSAPALRSARGSGPRLERTCRRERA